MLEIDRDFTGISDFAVIVQKLSLARDIETIMSIVRKAARTITGADGATFILREGDNCHYADEDAIAPLWKGCRFPMSACISGWVMLNRKEAAIEDIYSDDRIPVDAYRPTFVKSLLMMPIRKIDPIGAIGIYWATPHKSTPDEVVLLQALADSTSVAMENIQVYSQLELRLKELKISNDQLQFELQERKQTEEALRESERHLRNSQRIAHLGSWRLDVATNQVIWTEELYNMYGFDPSQPPPPYTEHMKLFTPPSWEKLSTALANTTKTGIPYELELETVKKDRSKGWMWVRGEAIRDSNGKTIGLWGAAQDITERKNVEEALRVSEERYSLIIEAVNDGVWDWNVQTGAAYFSPRYYSLLGYQTDEFVSNYTNWRILVHPDDIVQVEEKLQHSIDKGEGFSIDLRMKKKSGGWLWVSTRGKVIEWDSHNKALRMVGTLSDITERKQIERQLAFHASLHDQVHNAIIAIDLQNRILFWNRYAETLYQWKSFEAVGKDIIELLSPREMKNEVNKNFTELNRDGHWEGKFDVLKKDGSTIPVHIINTKLTDLEGNHIGFIGISEDITDRNRIETALQNAQKLESLGVLAGGIAHDFNNLLGGIYGYIELAGENDAKNDMKLSQHLSKAINTIERARNLTLQLITFAKGGAPVKSVDHLFPFVLETAQFALSGSNIRPIFDIQRDLWLCEFDKNQIGQVVDNIVINAKQSMPNGGTIEISASNILIKADEHPVLDQGQYIKISIKDTGTGIPREIQSRIFDPFFTTKKTGHGLGLATCYSIIKRHGGSIDVESIPGNGSTFHIFLPATDKELPSKIDRIHKGFRGKGTFVVMDDEEVMRDVTSSMLEAFGYNVICKENGTEALEFIMQELSAGRKIEGGIFDLTVPGEMGGEEAMQALIKSGYQVLIFASSGHAEDPIISTPKEFGFAGSICKPFRKTELLELLQMHLRNYSE